VAGFVLIQNWGGFTKVDLCAGVLGAEVIAIKHFADGDGVVCGVEGADDAAEGRERGERV